MLTQNYDSITASIFDRIKEILGCKWSLSILDCLQNGTNRPGRIERALPGLTARVLHRCLNRMEQDGILARTVYAEVPPHVEYELTDRGRELVRLVDQLRRFADNWASQKSLGGDNPLTS